MRQTIVLMLYVAVLQSVCHCVSADVSGYRELALGHPNIYHYYSIENPAQRGEDTAPVLEQDKLHLEEEGYSGPFGVPDPSVHIAKIVYEQTDLAGETSTTITPYNANATTNGLNDDGAALISPGGYLFGDFQIPDQLTIEVLVKSTGQGPHEYFVVAGSRGIQRGNFLFQDTHTPGFGTWNGGKVVGASTAKVPITQAIKNDWYFVALRTDYTDLANNMVHGSYRYANLTAKDASLSDSVTFSNAFTLPPPGNSRFAVGMHLNPDWACFCSIDEVGLFDTLLTDEELDSHYMTLTGSSDIGVSDLLGDYNGDGIVNLGDLNLVLFNWNSNTVPAEWTNMIPEGTVDIEQLNTVLFNWNNMASIAAVPEPSGVVLILLGGLLVFASPYRKRAQQCC